MTFDGMPLDPQQQLRTDADALVCAMDSGKLGNAETRLLKLAICLLDEGPENISHRVTVPVIAMTILTMIADDYRLPRINRQ